MSGQHTPMAQVSEDAVFFLRKQSDGSRWPVGTQLFASTPLIAAAPELLKALEEAVLIIHAEFGSVPSIIENAIVKASPTATDAGVAG